MKAAFFITPHGFGHATRACALMDALAQRLPAIFFEIYTTVPQRLFCESLPNGLFNYNRFKTDIGLVQKNSFSEDEAKTVFKLKEELPYPEDLMGKLAKRLAEQEVEVVFCDISALGISMAFLMNTPSVLIENFTWPWIYSFYPEIVRNAGPQVRFMEELFASASLRIQTEPVCMPVNDCIKVGPIARKPKGSRAEVRERLSVDPKARVILITMGGMGHNPDDFMPYILGRDAVFILAGSGRTKPFFRENIRVLPAFSGFYHPDLIAASDIVIGKLGYSTLSECYLQDIPFYYIKRRLFPESEILDAFAQKKMKAKAFDEYDLKSGHVFMAALEGGEPGKPGRGIKEPDGAADAAGLISDWLGSFKPKKQGLP